MEQRMMILKKLVLFTTGADYHECQQQTWWDESDIVISLDERGARILKGERNA